MVDEHNTGLLVMSQVTPTICVQKYKVYKTAQQSCLNCLHNYSGCDVHQHAPKMCSINLHQHHLIGANLYHEQHKKE